LQKKFHSHPHIYLADWLERLTANAKVETVLSSISASSDTVESEGRQMKNCKYSAKKILKNPPVCIATIRICESLSLPFYFVTFSVIGTVLYWQVAISVADPGSGAFLTPGFWMGKKSRSGSGMNIPDHISNSLKTIFWVKNT
jgi:hypothetical protein